MHLQDVFQIGERVRCLVMGMDDNFTRISLSTAELEENEGDIMFEKVLPACSTVHARSTLFLGSQHEPASVAVCCVGNAGS